MIGSTPQTLRRRLAAVAAGLAFTVGACTTGTTSSTAPSADPNASAGASAVASAGASVAVAPLTLKIGVVTPLSAPGDYQGGTEIKKGVEVFASWWNANNSDVKLEITGVEDDKGSPATGAAAFERLIQNGANAVVGDYWGAVTLAQIPVAVKYDVPMVVGCAWADSVTTDHNKNVFRVGLYDALGAQKAIQYFKEANIKNVAMLSEDTDHGKGWDAGLRSEAKAQGWDLNLTTRFVPAQGKDFTADLIAVKNINPKPEVLIVDMVSEGHFTMINQAYEVGLAPGIQMIGQYNFPESPDFWKSVGSNGLGIQYFGYAPPNSEVTPVGQDLITAFGNRPSVWTMWQWDVLLALATAARDANSTDKDKMIAALENIRFTGPTGEVSFPKDGTGISYHQRESASFYLMQLDQDGDGFEQAKTVWPAS